MYSFILSCIVLRNRTPSRPSGGDAVYCSWVNDSSEEFSLSVIHIFLLRS